MSKRFLSILIMTAMILTTILPMIPLAAQAAGSEIPIPPTPPTPSFYTSFESTDAAPLDKALQVEGKDYISGIQISKKGAIKNYAPTNPVTGSYRYADNEGLNNLIDGSTGTKYLTNMGIPCYVTYEYATAVSAKGYEMSAANDASERDPKNWKIEGSNDNSTWTLLDERSNQAFANRYQTNLYSFSKTENIGDYKYYKITITANKGGSGSGSGMTQFSELLYVTEVPAGGVYPNVTALGTEIAAPGNVSSNGDGSTVNGRGWTGTGALHVYGDISNTNAYAYKVLYENLNIPVQSNTRLSYLILPDYPSAYDYDYTSHFMAIDLEFTDGTFLRNLGAVDEYGYKLSPYEQGNSKILYTRCWNDIYSNIGAVASGKTIKNVLVGYENPRAVVGNKIKAYIDDIKIANQSDPVYTNLADYVSILRGTNDCAGFSRGLTGPMVSAPHGFNFWAPHTTGSSSKLYNYQTAPSNTLKDITISHEPSYWVGERGTFQFMANTSISTNTPSSSQITSRGAAFKHENEIARAHYYGVTIDANDANAPGVKIEVTPTEHAAVLRFTFPENAANKNVILDSVFDSGTNRCKAVTFSNNTFDSYSTTQDAGGGGSNGLKRMYVYGEFDRNPSLTYNVTSNVPKAMARFTGSNVVTMKVATSFISLDQAKKNLALEVGASSFEDIFTKALNDWNAKLGTVQVEGATYDQKVSLYSNLYRSFLYPNLLSENTGTAEAPVWKYASPYSGTVENPTIKTGRLYYNNGFWDTYRTTWSEYALLTPNKATDLLNGLVQHYNDVGWVPRWIAPGGTNSMVGTNSDAIFADALNRGMTFDVENAYLSSLKNGSVVTSNATNGGRANMNISTFLGYTPTNSSNDQGFSWGIESCINDAAIAQMAKTLRDKETVGTDAYQKLNDEYIYFTSRAKWYANTWTDDLGGWLRPMDENGNYYTSNGAFNPKNWGNGFTEENAWNYVFTVPHDGNGLANLMGGKAALAAKLDEYFSTKNDLGSSTDGIMHEAREARELKMGQYGHNNQPSHHTVFMYNYAGKPYKTQALSREILSRLYQGSSIGQGFPGDEDNGEMGAWYVLASLGLYPLNMGNGQFNITSPLFTKATITKDNGEKIIINAPNNSKENVYIKSLKVDGVDYNKTVIDHSALVGHDVTFDYVMTSDPNNGWGTAENSLPPSLTTGTERPSPMKDMTVKTATQATAAPATAPTSPVYFFTGDATVTNGGNLFDNTSSTTTTISGNNAQINYCFTKPTLVEMYTITSPSSTSASDAKDWTFSGSNDGTNWTKLDERSNQTFRWRQYTRPFAVAKPDKYQYYKLDITAKSGTANMQIAEFELLSDPTNSLDKSDVLDAINAAKAIDKSLYAPVTYANLEQAIAKAQLVYDKADATKSEMANAIYALSAATKGLAKIRDAKEIIEAESVDGGEGIKTESTSGCTMPDGRTGVSIGNLANTIKNSWSVYKYVDFGAPGALKFNSFTASYANFSGECTGARVEVRLDSINGPTIGSVVLQPYGTGWQKYQLATGAINADISGIHDVYVAFFTDNVYAGNFDYFQFGTTWKTTATSSLSGNSITVNASVSNTSGAAKLVKVIAAAYDQSNVLISSKQEEVNISGTSPFNFNLDVTGAVKPYTVRVFTWASEGMVPLYDVIVSKVQ